MFFAILRLLAAVAAAFLAGKLVSKLKLPGILGWLIAGMVLGPYALSLVDRTVLDARWYSTLMHVLECTTGLLMGTELVWRKLKHTGKSVLIITFSEVFITFGLATLAFGVIFCFMQIPLYLAILFGAIALATAPAPAISVAKSLHTRGPVTDTLIPMAALENVLSCVVFFSVIALVAGNLSAGAMSPLSMAMLLILPLVIGVGVGFLVGLILRREMPPGLSVACTVLGILAATIVGLICSEKVMINFTLIGMAFASTFSNMVTKEQLERLMGAFEPFLGAALIAVIMNLGLPLDYHLILEAGVFTAVYIIIRAIGKYFGAFTGATLAGTAAPVRKF